MTPIASKTTAESSTGESHGSAQQASVPVSRDIKNMKLYQNFERVENELFELINQSKLIDGNKLQAKDLYPFDNMHYHGVSAVKETLQPSLTALRTEGSGQKEASEKRLRVLDVGSGLGGPARFIATELNCDVVALELQKDCHEHAALLTEKVGLKSQIKHFCGDILNMKGVEIQGEFDMVVSFLVFLHISEKEKLFNKCNDSLKEGGYLCFEDFYKRGAAFTSKEVELLNHEVFCKGEKLPTEDAYKAVLQASGFEIVKFEDMTADWSAFVHGRFAAYVESKERQVRVHNEETFESQKRFYQVMDELFNKGKGNSNLGGVRVVARKVSK